MVIMKYGQKESMQPRKYCDKHCREVWQEESKPLAMRYGKKSQSNQENIVANMVKLMCNNKQTHHDVPLLLPTLSCSPVCLYCRDYSLLLHAYLSGCLSETTLPPTCLLIACCHLRLALLPPDLLPVRARTRPVTPGRWCPKCERRRMRGSRSSWLCRHPRAQRMAPHHRGSLCWLCRHRRGSLCRHRRGSCCCCCGGCCGRC